QSGAADVPVRRRNRAPLLPRQRGEDGGQGGGLPHLVRDRARRRLGVGHVSPGPLRVLRQGGHLQGRQRRRAARKGALRRTVPVTLERRALGMSGEDLAAAWYEANGYEVLARNWRCREGELDLVVRRGRTIVFCEVKTRGSDAFGLPVEAVSRSKRQRVRVLAATWLDD